MGRGSKMYKYHCQEMEEKKDRKKRDGKKLDLRGKERKELEYKELEKYGRGEIYYTDFNWNLPKFCFRKPEIFFMLTHV